MRTFEHTDEPPIGVAVGECARIARELIVERGRHVALMALHRLVLVLASIEAAAIVYERLFLTVKPATGVVLRT